MHDVAASNLAIKPGITSASISADSATLATEGVALMGVGYDKNGLKAELAVADDHAIQTMYDRYGGIALSGWLQPV